MVVIDTEKCIGCGLCAADCPAEKLAVADGKAVYTPGCIQCGHREKPPGMQVYRPAGRTARIPGISVGPDAGTG